MSQWKVGWPELLGQTGKVAKETIERERPDLLVHYIICGEVRILDCCCNRVWLDVNPKGTNDFDNGIVCKVPRVG
ncbi:Proteinase inhibitor I13 potato inhibitor I protein [Dioscorea alata]|uniref:Proteinase inhibitor I13 potato inhibitor I protein n=1 Tax=Dioscorea alata TaxID=55571 RepID=A0ACB7VQM2_DIOAL|nr:Proteinase inhibitor I13 potato inhibitor I protein [Dioscorea alata]